MRPVRKLGLAVWLGVLIAGSTLILFATDGPVRHWVAAERLPKHHLVQDRDLAFPFDRINWIGRVWPARDAVVGRYTTAPIERGAALWHDKLSSVPDLASDDPQVTAVFAVERALVETGVNAGTRVPLCYDRRALPTKAEVVAVFCGERTTHTCWVLVALSDQNLRWFVAMGSDAGSLGYNPRPGLRCRVDLP